MKIVHVLTRGDVLGGAQSHVRELSLQLRSLGHEVIVITGRPGLFTDQLKQSGIPWVQVPSLVRPLRPHRDLVALLHLWYVLPRLKPDVVCVHTAKAGSLGRAAARLRHIPSVFTPHGWSMVNRATLKPHRFFRLAESLAGRLGARVINVCEYERAYAERLHVCPEKTLEVVHNGISETGLVRTRPVDLQPPLIVMVARFTAQKDHATLVEALSGLLHRNWRLLLVGAGELQPLVVAQVNAMGLGDRASLLPESTDVGELLMRAQIFALVTNFEAMPITLLEAMRASLPVVATNVGGIGEALCDGETGILVPRGNVTSLREALERLIADPALRMSMGQAGRRRWASHFTAGAMAARTVEVYKRALLDG
jgi:glycosyltransferase involved in cell wall biosynthesis